MMLSINVPAEKAMMGYELQAGQHCRGGAIFRM